MKSKKNILWIILLVAATTWILIRRNEGSYQSINGLIFGTIYNITYQHTDDLQAEIELELKRFDGSLSPFNKESAISRVNRNEAIVTDSLFQVCFNRAIEVSKETNGAFDITCLPEFTVFPPWPRNDWLEFDKWRACGPDDILVAL